MRSSSEWKVTTASQPPGASAASAAASPRASSPSSSLTAMRSAWKLRVAACGWPGFGRGSSRSIRPASCSVRRRTARSRAVGDDGAGDAPRGALLAELEEDVGERRLRQPVHQVGRRWARLAPCACRAARPSGTRTRAPAWSSCIEETPMSSTTPSSAGAPGLRGDPVELAEAARDAASAGRRRPPPRRRRAPAPRGRGRRRSPAPRRRRAAPRA